MKRSESRFSFKVLLALAAVAMLCLALVLVGCGKKDDAPATDDSNHVQLYWNVDRMDYVAGNADGTSGRYPRGDGFYYVRLAAGGQQQDYQVEDYAVVNKMELVDMFMPIFDERGVIVDIKTVNECTGGFLAPKLYVKSVEGNTVHANTQGSFLGMDMDFVIDEETEVYDVGGGGILTGVVGQIEMDDELVVIKDLDGTIGTVYVFGYTPVGDIYWNIHRMYDSTSKTTTRDPDGLGYYNFELALNGEVVNLRTRDYKLANNIDAQAAKCFALTFDENGDILTRESTSYAGISATFGSWYHVTDIQGDKVTAERIAAGTDQGNVMEAVMSKDCKVIDVSEVGGYSGKITELRVGDQIHGLRDKRGRIAYIFVHVRAAGEEAGYKLCYNEARKYDSTKLETTRLPDANGWYYADVFYEGNEITVKTQDKALMTKLDAISNNVLALKLDENNVFTAVTSGYGAFGGTSVGAFYYIDTLDGANFTAHHDYGSTMSGTISADTIIYNVSDAAGRKGELTELQVDDRFIGIGDLYKNIRVIYVIKRAVKSPLYWNLTRNYNSTTKETTKKPDADGFYWFTMASEGKQLKLKTREKEIATKIDSNAALCHGFFLNGDEITKVIPAGSVKGLNGGTRKISWVDVIYKEGNYLICQKNQAGHEQDGNLFEVIVGNACKIYDVSSGYIEFQGEKTEVRVGDKIAAYHDGNAFAMYIWIVGGRSKPINPNKYDCPCAEGVTWEPWDGTTELQDGMSYYLTNDVVAPTEGFYLENMAVNLRLDGHTISSDGRCFYIQAGGKLNICDHGTRGKLIGSGVSGESGGVIRVYTASGGVEVNCWNIDIEYKDAGHPAKEGGLISAAGPVSLYDVNLKGGVASGKGGNVTVSIYGNFRMFGGSAVNGNAKGGNGGNINVEGIGYLEGVTISGGKATSNGKDVYYTGASYAKRLKDITLTSGVNGLYLNSCKVEVDGTLNTGMTMAGTTTLVNLGLSSSSKITVKKGSEGTVLSGANTDMTGIFTNSDTSGDYVLEYDSKAKEVVMVSTIVARTHETEHCMCNGVASGVAEHNCDEIGDWIEITDAVFETAYGTAGESRGIKFKESGNYYLSVPYTLKSGLCIMPDQEITICLNGYRLTGSNQAGRVAGTLNITDCLGGGRVTSLADATNANTIKVLAGGEFNFFGGTMTSEASCTDGGVVGVTMDKGGLAPADSTEPGVMNMYGGTITGGAAKNGGNIIVWHSSIFNMYGGIIEKGTSDSAGDNIRFSGTGVVANLLGGTIREGDVAVANGQLILGGNMKIEGLTLGGKVATIAPDGLGSNAKITLNVSAAGTLVTNVSASDFEKFSFNIADSSIAVSYNDATDSIVAKFSSNHKHCVCGGVDPDDHSCTTAEWMPLNASTVDNYFSVSSSRYVANSSKLYLYLTEDLDLTYSINLNDGQYIALCLNGFDLKHTKTANPVARVWGDLDITDCSADRDGQIIGYRTGESPCLYIQNWVSGTQWTTPTINLFAGTLTAKDGNSTAKAGVVQIGNKVSTTGDNWVTFNMYGGKICGGHATNGGNVYLETTTCIFNMYGGEISGGTASASGGGIYANGAVTLNILGGKITGNTCGTGYGADVYAANNTKATLGGTVTIGEFYSNALVLTLKNLDAASSIGLLRSTDAEALFATGATTDVSKCFKNPDFTAVWDSAAKTLSFVVGGTTPVPPVVTDHNHCICGGEKPSGHSCADTGFVKLTQADFTNATADSAPVRISGTNYELAAGSYYLGEDITVSKSIVTVDGATVNLCLNGKTLTGNKVRTFYLKAKFTFTDCGSTGTVTSTAGEHAPVMYVRTGATVNVYGCTFIGSKLGSTAATGGGTLVVGGTLNTYNATIKGGDASAVKKNGGNIVICDGGTFKMYGGEISGGKVATSQSGGNIRLDSGSFYLYDGTVKGGYGNEGGNIAIGSSGKVYISGGVVEGGQAVSNGGNFAVFGLLEISGGTIRNGAAGVNGKTDATGGNITTYANKSVINITGGLIENGVAPAGANIALRTTGSTAVKMTMTGGEIKGGDLKSVFVNNYAAITITVGGDAKIDTVYLAGPNRRVVISTSKPLTAAASIGIAATTAQTVVDGRTDLTNFKASDSANYELVEEGGNLVLKAK